MAGHRIFTQTGTGQWRDIHTLSLFALVGGILLVNLLLPAALRFWAWLGTQGLLTAFALIVGHGVTGLWFGLLIDSRNKLSLSRLQMLLWTILVLTGFLAAVFANIDAGYSEPLAVIIPGELWLLMGINTVSLVGSPLIVQAKRARPVSEEEKAQVLLQLARQAVDVARVAIHGQVVVNQTAEAAGWSDLFRGSETGNAGQIDLGKVQMFFFTLILLLAYGAALAQLFGSAAGKIVGLPTLDGGMLALMGISNLGYLVNKALPKTGWGGTAITG